jgi:peptidoglycan/LPS O-acetylase OafA/YrhL
LFYAVAPFVVRKLENVIGRRIYFPEARIAYVSLALASTLPFLHALSQRVWIDRAVGELSYGMYLVHLPIVYTYQHLLGHIGSVPVALLSMAAAALLDIAIERPIDKLRQRLVERRASAPCLRPASSAVPGVLQVTE